MGGIRLLGVSLQHPSSQTGERQPATLAVPDHGRRLKVVLTRRGCAKACACSHRPHSLPLPAAVTAASGPTACRDGCTKVLMIAHGFTVEQMARVRITEARRRALAGEQS